ncbi:MAG: DUF4388 domain-containing protein [Verrucomicrobia bacterium]|nr:DUF4388 domain-containing protein [Verrucomicrobiota bacterium]
MHDDRQLRDGLIQNGRLSPDATTRADAYAAEHKAGFADALLALSLMDAGALRALQAELAGIPYRERLPDTIPQRTVDMLSARCALRWGAFPIEYAEGQRRLTLAISDTGRAPFLRNIHDFLMQPHELAFVITHDNVIAAAIQDRLSEDPPAPVDEPRDSKTLRPLSINATKTRPQASAGGADGATSRRKKSRHDEAGIEYEIMSQALVSAVAMIARMHLADDAAGLSAILERVRYSQLLGARLKLNPAQRDSLVISAWASALWPQRELIQQLDTPYEIENIVFADSTSAGKPLIEASILSLITTYQELYRLHPDVCQDVNLTRRELRARGAMGNDHENVLETFLQVLVDEEFLSSLDASARRVLIVDPGEVPFSDMSQALIQSGYEVATIGDPIEAERVFKDFHPNVVLISMDLPRDGGLTLCGRIRKLQDGEKPTLMALLSPANTRMATVCLREGADDFLITPVDPELLFLKLRARLGDEGTDGGQSGVSGHLRDMSFNDMIQIFTAGRRSIEIALRQGSQVGQVWMQEGKIIHAVAEDQTGESAFYALMRWRDGEFETRQISNFPQATIDISTVSLLMEGSRLADES